MHKKFTTTVEHCFETSRPDEVQLGIELLKKDNVRKINDEYTFDDYNGKQEKVNQRTYNNDKKIFMPPMAKEIMKTLKKQENAIKKKEDKEHEKQKKMKVKIFEKSETQEIMLKKIEKKVGENYS